MTGSRSSVEVDLGAIAGNVRALAATADPAGVCAVVKADGYGHGAARVAAVALEAGACMVAVAQIGEAIDLRSAGIDGPLMLLSEPSAGEVDDVVRLRVEPLVYRPYLIDELAARVRTIGAGPVRVHLKVDTGMQRVGCRPTDALDLARHVAAGPELELVGLATHLAVADDPDDPTTPGQLARFDTVAAELAAEGLRPGLLHAANSAGAIAHRSSRYGMVRCGIALYGIPPSPALDGAVDLAPAMRFTSQVSFVKRVEAGSRISYGHMHRFERDSTVATVPVGYADGVPRALGTVDASVLIGGRRRPIVGVVTMDQLMVDCGPDATVAVDDEVVLIGEQGDDRITADEWARLTGTIAYEIVCNAGRRARRTWLGP